MDTNFNFQPSNHQLQQAASDLTGDNVFGFGVNLNRSQLKQFAETGVNPVTGQEVHGQDLEDLRVLASASSSQFKEMASDNGGGKTIGDWSTASFGLEGADAPISVHTSYGNGHLDGGNEGIASPFDGATDEIPHFGSEEQLEMKELKRMMRHLSQMEGQLQNLLQGQEGRSFGHPSDHQLQDAANDLTGDNVFGFGVNLTQSQLKQFAATGVNPVTGQQVHGQDLQDLRVLASASQSQFNAMASDNGGGKTVGDWSTASFGLEGADSPITVHTSYSNGHLDGGNEGISSPYDGATSEESPFI